eukprot:CAMPEP_0170336648 /NCGR_PEP_ID=MMETSP0116_2-20130129/69368_1 /TAXON_ID=400756 /ORGANISM="Durinskia baltica, Strain CSIRO CS-38" /LENGTH=89 /DNA_ID=CAMNT_0010590039 /DNA_START=149 /DNA_END=418 /DNA_ORIENTATION=+
MDISGLKVRSGLRVAPGHIRGLGNILQQSERQKCATSLNRQGLTVSATRKVLWPGRQYQCPETRIVVEEDKVAVNEFDGGMNSGNGAIV